MTGQRELWGHKVIAGAGGIVGRAARAVGARFDADHAASTAYAALAAAVVLSGLLLGLAVSREDLAMAAGTGATLAALSALAAAVDRLYVTARDAGGRALAAGGLVSGPGPVVEEGPETLLIPKLPSGSFTSVTLHMPPVREGDDDPAQDRG